MSALTRGGCVWLALLVSVGLLACLDPAGPPPEVSAIRATDLGTLPASSKIVGRDGGSSAVFQGQSVWLYGDTFLTAPDVLGRTLISNSWSWTSDLDATAGIAGFRERDDAAGAPSMFLSETPAELAFDEAHQGSPCRTQPCGARWALWPGAMVTDPARNRALIFYTLVYAEPGSFNFYGLGTSVAIWSDWLSQPQRPIINATAVHPDLLFAQNEPPFGTAAVAQGDTLYAYACNTRGLDKPCLLGKVGLASVLERSAWTYYAGGGRWSAGLDGAVPLFSGGSIMSLSWNGFLERYVAVYSPPFSDRVMLRTAPRPEGPWSGETIAFTALAPVGGSSWVYDAQAHPEYNHEGGRRMFVTYSRSTGLFSSEVRLVALDLERSP